MPQVAVGTNGRVAVVWQESDQSIPFIFAAVNDVLGIWNAAEIISSNGIKSTKPNVAFSSDGKATSVWFRYDVAAQHHAKCDRLFGYFGTGL